MSYMPNTSKWWLSFRTLILTLLLVTSWMTSTGCSRGKTESTTPERPACVAPGQFPARPFVVASMSERGVLVDTLQFMALARWTTEVVAWAEEVSTRCKFGPLFPEEED